MTQLNKHDSIKIKDSRKISLNKNKMPVKKKRMDSYNHPKILQKYQLKEIQGKTIPKTWNHWYKVSSKEGYWSIETDRKE